MRRTAAGWCAILAIVVAPVAGAQDAARPNGLWLTESGEAVVEMVNCGSRLCGRIVWLKSPTMPDGTPKTDRRNPAVELRERPICGLQIVGDLAPAEPRKWTGGWVYDPESGKTYTANLTLESETALRLRGYVGMPLLGETQVWHRAPANQPRCAG